MHSLGKALERTYCVESHDEGARLDRLLASLIPEISRSQLQKAIDGGLVFVNGRPAKKNVRLRRGDVIVTKEAMVHDLAHPSLKAEDIPLEIIYEDDYFIAINKPAGLVVHPGSGNRRGTVVNALMHHATSLAEGFGPDRPGIVHRIDKDTSGVLIAAKTNEAHAALAQLFAKRHIRKFYLGICFGRPSGERGSINVAVGRSASDPLRQAAQRGGRDALTDYEVLESKSGVSIIRFRLHTGRTHQIRVHSSHGNFPIVGDELYGGGRGRISRLPPLERSFALQVFSCFKRQALHALRVEFHHPFQNAPVVIAAPLPADFQDVLRLFGMSEKDLAPNVPDPRSVINDHSN